jgi:hemerythrin-like domain-containing protein
MLRDKSLVPLSRQHQHALALCVRLDRALHADEIELDAWQTEIAQIFEQEITIHFAAEEKELFPVAEQFPDLQPLVDELRTEHVALRDGFACARSRTLGKNELSAFAVALSQHIRKEERQLFEGLQKLMSAAELAALGAALEQELGSATPACTLPNSATRLRYTE